MAKNNLYQQTELSWGHNDPISNILNKRLQDETKIKGTCDAPPLLKTTQFSAGCDWWDSSSL